MHKPHFTIYQKFVHVTLETGTITSKFVVLHLTYYDVLDVTDNIFTMFKFLVYKLFFLTACTVFKSKNCF